MFKTSALGLAVLCISLAYSSDAHGRSPMTDSTDVQVNETAPADEREGSIFVSPANPNVIIASSNGVSSNPSAWISTNGGGHWSQNANFAGGAGDPAAVINVNPTFPPDGRYLVAHLGTLNGGPASSYKDSVSAQWTTKSIRDEVSDKPHLWVDNSDHSPADIRFNLYTVWNKSQPGDSLMVARSDDGGDFFDIKKPIVQRIVPTWGANIQTGRTGRIYVVWPLMGKAGPSGITSRFEFIESADEVNFTFSATTDTIGIVAGMNQNSLQGGSISRATTYPSMAVDKSDPDGDYLFLVYSEEDPDIGEGTDIRLMRGFASLSPEAPVVWYDHPDSIITVNQDFPSENDQWWPWITWDECTDMISVVFMDSRASDHSAAVYAATSGDHGKTWTETRVSDVNWSKNTDGAGYDYIGISAGDGRAYPLWSDDRHDLGSNNFRPYTSWILLWGIEQSSVSISTTVNGDSMTVTAEWTTVLVQRIQNAQLNRNQHHRTVQVP